MMLEFLRLSTDPTWLSDIAAGMRALDEVAIQFHSMRISLMNILASFVVALIAYMCARFTYRFLIGMIENSRRLDLSHKTLLKKLSGMAVVTIAGIVVIQSLGFDLAAFSIFSGAFGLAVGFGLQRTLGNLIAGLILLIDKSVKPGDVIVVGDTFGAINRIGIRAVSVVTRDGKEHLIPNEKLLTESVENWSYSSREVRLRIPVGVSYGCDLALAQKLMLEAAVFPKRVLPEPAPAVWLRRFGDSAVEHEILVWITDPEEGVGNVQSEVLNKLWLLFKDHNIEIPFPQQDIHIRSLPLASPAS